MFKSRFPFFILIVFVAGCAVKVSTSADALSTEESVVSSTLPETESVLLERFAAMDDPDRDGWQTEAFNEASSKYFKDFAKSFTEDGGAKRELFSSDPTLVSLDDQEPNQRAQAEGGYRFEQRKTGEDDTGQGREIRGNGAILSYLRERLGFVASPPLRFKAKTIRVDLEDEAPSTLVRIESLGRLDGVLVEGVSHWRVSWDGREDLKNLRIKAIRVEEERRTEYTRGESEEETPVMFTDCTQSALEANKSYQEQILRGANDWLVQQRVNEFYGYPGIAIGDVNGDHLEDFYLCEMENLPNRLFIQNADGTFSDRSADWGIDWVEDSRGGLFVDLDNDGDQDLALSTLGHLVLAENTGHRFVFREALRGCLDATQLSAADYDLDGKV
ncbi:MAG: VCBS repeat-containing protein, partial [Verrucomicrobiota bacterium]